MNTVAEDIRKIAEKLEKLTESSNLPISQEEIRSIANEIRPRVSAMISRTMHNQEPNTDIHYETLVMEVIELLSLSCDIIPKRSM